MIFHYPLTSFISYTLSAETGPDHSKCSTTKLSGQVNNSNEPLTFEICDLLIYGYMESGRILGELTLKSKFAKTWVDIGKKVNILGKAITDSILCFCDDKTASGCVVRILLLNYIFILLSSKIVRTTSANQHLKV